jgi:uncharacterized protein DUF2809
MSRDRRARLRLLAAASVPLTIGILSKYYRGPGSEHVLGQALDFFGTVFMILALRIAILRPPAWKVAAVIVGALTVMEISQSFHGELLERARSTWIGLHVLGSCFEWLDFVAYYLGGAVAVWLEPRIVGLQKPTGLT